MLRFCRCSLQGVKSVSPEDLTVLRSLERMAPRIESPLTENSGFLGQGSGEGRVGGHHESFGLKQSPMTASGPGGCRRSGLQDRPRCHPDGERQRQRRTGARDCLARDGTLVSGRRVRGACLRRSRPPWTVGAADAEAPGITVSVRVAWTDGAVQAAAAMRATLRTAPSLRTAQSASPAPMGVRRRARIPVRNVESAHAGVRGETAPTVPRSSASGHRTPAMEALASG